MAGEYRSVGSVATLGLAVGGRFYVLNPPNRRGQRQDQKRGRQDEDSSDGCACVRGRPSKNADRDLAGSCRGVRYSNEIN